MKQKLLFMLTAAILSLLPFSAKAANVITMTVKTAGETLDLYIQATGAVTIDGATGTYKPDAWVTYTTTAKTITVTGDVTTLASSRNDVTALDVSRNTVLTVLECYYSQLTTLDVSHNTALTTLWCYSNALTSLDVSHNTALTTLFCNDNKLTALNVSKNTALTRLHCYNNQIKGAAMDALVASLPDRSGQTTKGTLAVFYNNADGNVMSTIQVADAKARGWNATNYNLQAYAGSTPPTITMTTTKAAGKTISLGIQATGSVTLTGVSEAYTAGQNTYTLTAPTVTLTGDVTALDCFNNSLTALDVSNNTALTTLNCYSNQLTALDVSKLTALAALNFCKNQLAAIDVSHNTALTSLNCGANQLTALDVGHNTALSTLQCYSNQLTTLDVSMLTALTYLMCGDNLFTTLDVSKNTALSWLECTRNQLTALDISKNTALTTLTCATNQLTALDLSHNTALSWLACQNNQLTALDLSHNTALTTLTCYNNPLAALDLSHNTALTSLECYGCQFKGTVMDALIASLPDRTGAEAGKFTVSSDKELDTNRNICTTTQVDAARAKNWNSFYYSNANSAYLDYSGERQYVITMTTAKAVGKTLKFFIKSTGDITLTGVSEAYSPQRDTYTLTAPTVTITGAVTILSCNGDSLTALDVSQNSLLQELWCSNNLLTALDVDNNIELRTISFYQNQINGLQMDKFVQSLYDLTRCQGKGNLYAVDTSSWGEGNVMTSLQVSEALSRLWNVCDANWQSYAGSEPDSIDFLTTMAEQATLEMHIVGTGRIVLSGATMSPTGNDRYITNSKHIVIRGNVTELQCTGMELTTLDASHNRVLQKLNCSNNKLTELILHSKAAAPAKPNGSRRAAPAESTCASLQQLDCSNNALSDLDLTGLDDLIMLNCYDNQIKENEMGSMVSTLVNRSNKDLMGTIKVIDDDSETEGNVINTQQVDEAQKLGWDIENNDGIHYIGTTPNAIKGVQASDGAEPAAIYDATGRRIPQMHHGVNIVRMSNGRTKKVIQ